MEHWEILAPGGYRFVYDDALFRPSTDTFLLASLPRLKPGLRVCDLGCGTGLLSLLLLQRQPALFVTGIDRLPAATELARKAAEINGLAERLTICSGDLRAPLLPAGGFDLAVCNPPYYPVGSGGLPAGCALRSARSEATCSLPERLADLCCALRETGLEPKRLRLVCKNAASAPSLILLEARRGGRPGLAIEPALLLQTSDGTPTAEVNAIYFRQQEDLS